MDSQGTLSRRQAPRLRPAAIAVVVTTVMCLFLIGGTPLARTVTERLVARRTEDSRPSIVKMAHDEWTWPHSGDGHWAIEPENDIKQTLYTCRFTGLQYKDQRLCLASCAALMPLLIFPPTRLCPPTTGKCVDDAQPVKRIGKVVVKRLLSGDVEGVLFEAGMKIDADGAPHAFCPDGTGLDNLANAGHNAYTKKQKDGTSVFYPRDWWGVATDTDERSGTPITKAAGPDKGCYVSKTALNRGLWKLQESYVDSEKIPYIAVPPELRKTVLMGDFVSVINARNGQSSYAIVGDEGNSGKIGEGSIALAKALGISNTDPKSGGVDDKIQYVVFAGTGNRRPRTLNEINAEADKWLKMWGGEQQMRACFP